MLIEFLLWWRTQLLDALPAQFRSGMQTGRALIAAVSDLPQGAPPIVELLIQRRGRDSLLGRFTLDGAGVAALRAAATGRRGEVVLRLPPGILLEQRVSLPLAADRDPERVLAYEMDRLTPFAAADLFWTWAVDRRDRAAGQVRYRVFLVPKARLQPLLGGLASAGLRPVVLDATAPDGIRRRLALAAPDRGWLRRRGPVLAGGLCTTLALMAASLPFLAQSLAAGRTEAQISTLRPAVQQAEALRKAVLDRNANTGAIEAGRARAGDPLGVLAALTTVLPDDTYLSELTLRRRALSITGESTAAARLIAALAAEPGFRNPVFAAPVTRSIDGRSEGFTIRVEVAP